MRALINKPPEHSSICLTDDQLAQVIIELVRTLFQEHHGSPERRRRRLMPDEVVSEVMMQLFEGKIGHNFDPSGDPIPFLKGVIRRLILSYDRKHRKRCVLPLDAAVSVQRCDETDPVSVAMHREALELTRAAWSSLTETRQEAIRAEYGAIFESERSEPEGEHRVVRHPARVPGKNYSARHRGVKQLREAIANKGLMEH